jgi:hypothetical protein
MNSLSIHFLRFIGHDLYTGILYLIDQCYFLQLENSVVALNECMQLELRKLLENCLYQVMEPHTHHMLCDNIVVVACIFSYGELWTEGNTHLLFEYTLI